MMPPMEIAEIVRAFADCGPWVESEMYGQSCIACHGEEKWIEGYNGPLEVPAAERKRRFEFVHDDDCAWVAAHRWAEEHPNYARGDTLGCPQCAALDPVRHDCLFLKADKLDGEYRSWVLDRLRAQVASGEELAIPQRATWWATRPVKA